jgi:hypothetical protein
MPEITLTFEKSEEQDQYEISNTKTEAGQETELSSSDEVTHTTSES